MTNRKAIGIAILAMGLLAPSQAFGLDVGFTSSQNKVYFEPPTEFHGRMTDTAQISLAKNEYEAVQMVLFPTTNLNNVRVTLSDLGCLTGPGEIPASQVEINVVGYVNQLAAKVSGDRIGWHPDPLLPNQALTLTADVLQPYLVTVHTLDTTREGTYEGTLTVRGDGMPDRVLTLRVNVWNFALPAVPSFRTTSLTFRQAPDDMWPGLVRSQEHRDTLLFRLADLAYRNRIPCTGALANGLESWTDHTSYGYPTHDGESFNAARTDRFLDCMLSKGANVFIIGYTFDIYDACCDATARQAKLLKYLRDYRAHLRARGLLDRAILYNIDEPWGDQVEHAKQIYTLIKDSVGTDLRIMQNTNQNNGSIIGTFMGYFDALDINLGHYDINNSDYYRQTYPSQMAEFWWNVNIWPDTHPNLFLEYPLVDARIFGPMSFKYDMQGFEYWNIKSKWSIGNYHPIASDELRVNWNVSFRSLDGCLVYAGDDFSIYSSLRFESFRDGAEDYEYLQMLKQKDPSSPLLNVDIISGLSTFTQDPEEILRFREQVALAIEPVASGTGDLGDSRPSTFSLAGNYPNPFNAGTVIRFSLSVATRIDLDIYNLLGQKLATLLAGIMPAGIHEIAWNGRLGDGKEAPSGVYLYKLAAPGLASIKKMLLLR